MKKELFVDKLICTGCRYCEAVCSLVHSSDQKVNPRRSSIIIEEDIPNGIFNPVVCKQCKKAPCVEVCQFDALAVDPQLGIPTIDNQKCSGCRDCIEACPFGAMTFDVEKEVAVKCDLCGGDPKCVQFCRALPHVGYAALSYLTAEEWSKRKIRIARKGR